MKYEDEAAVLEDICLYENQDICLVTQSEIEEEILNSLRQYKNSILIIPDTNVCLPILSQ